MRILAFTISIPAFIIRKSAPYSFLNRTAFQRKRQDYCPPDGEIPIYDYHGLSMDLQVEPIALYRPALRLSIGLLMLSIKSRNLSPIVSASVV